MRRFTDGVIVVGVNDSPAAQRAVEAGAREASLHRLRLELVHAFNWAPRLADATVPDPPASREALLRRALADAHCVAPDLPVETRSLEGPAVTVLLRRSRVAAMTVIGDGDLFDSICLRRDALAVQIAARATDTVWVTRSTEAPEGPVVVGVNGSAASWRALEFGFDEAARRRCLLVVVRAEECAEAEGDAGFGDFADRLAQKHAVTPVIHRLTEGPDVALRHASLQAGLVVVGARGRHPYAGLLGWVAQTILHHSPAPVVLVRGSVSGQPSLPARN